MVYVLMRSIIICIKLINSLFSGAWAWSRTIAPLQRFYFSLLFIYLFLGLKESKK